MSNINYDVELNISYDNNYRHYVPTYSIAVPYYSLVNGDWDDPVTHGWSATKYSTYISFDTESEIESSYAWSRITGGQGLPPDPLWNDTLDSDLPAHEYMGPALAERILTVAGVYSKIYFRNPNRGRVNFNTSNCHVRVNYQTKAAFEVQLNSSGYVASSNASFKCSTIEKNIPVQYGWSAATVFYKKTTDSTYSSVSGTVSGTWSDITVNSSLSLATGYQYNIYIQATADDGTTANTPVGVFETTDGPAIATCVSPVGTYTDGTVNFVWTHTTSYGTPQYAYDLQYSADNGGTWTTVANHVVSAVNSRTVSIGTAGVYVWRVRTYNTLDVAGDWAQASFINNIPATPPSNLVVTTKGRPTVTWTSTTQAAYQVQVLLNSEIVYDSGAIYTSQNSHFVNDYFDDTRSYTVRVRIYNSLGSVSEWTSTGYQQPAVTDVEFLVEQNNEGGAKITVTTDPAFTKYFLKRNNVLIGEITNGNYTDKYAVGLTNYSVVAVTSDDQSDIKSSGFRVSYPNASIVTLNGAQYAVNKRVDNAFEIQTSGEADINSAKFIGDSVPTHYFNKMRTKSFTVSFFDDNGILDEILGSVVFYADNFGNGGYCIVKSYDRTDNFIRNSSGIYANEVSLILEVTNYDDSIKYPI